MSLKRLGNPKKSRHCKCVHLQCLDSHKPKESRARSAIRSQRSFLVQGSNTNICRERGRFSQATKLDKVSTVFPEQKRMGIPYFARQYDKAVAFNMSGVEDNGGP